MPTQPTLTNEQLAGPWTRFWDMHSNGRQKTDFSIIFIELPKGQAIDYFEKIFKRDPYYVTCECCGEDFSVDEATDLLRVTGYYRNCKTAVGGNEYIEDPSNPKYITIEQMVADKNYKFIFKDEIK